MRTVSTIGLDIAKSVFQVHGVDAAHPGIAAGREYWPLAALKRTPTSPPQRVFL